MNRVWSIPPASAPTSTLRVEKGGPNSVYCTLSRRPYHEDPRSRGRYGLPQRLYFVDRRIHSRYGALPAARGRAMISGTWYG